MCEARVAGGEIFFHGMGFWGPGSALTHCLSCPVLSISGLAPSYPWPALPRMTDCRDDDPGCRLTQPSPCFHRSPADHCALYHHLRHAHHVSCTHTAASVVAWTMIAGGAQFRYHRLVHRGTSTAPFKGPIVSL
jgi:hypothetical protein